jgi:hypothetical protein
MKNLTLLLIVLSLLSCDKEVVKNSAQITGPDYRMCACCGGWFIEIDDTTYRFYELPKSSSIDLENETFPLEVTVKWKKTENACMSDLIDIEKITKE